MKWEFSDLQFRLRFIGALILLVGLVSAAWIYQGAEEAPYGALGYEGGGGALYPVMPENSKVYRHDLELYGGKANVIMDDFRRWFAGLWHGKSLAKTIAFFSIVISIGCFYAANHLLPPGNSEGPGENRRDDPN